MKKITVLLLTVLLSVFWMNANAQLTEDFETASPTGWTFFQTELDDPGFVQTSDEAHTGSNSFYHNDDDLSTTSEAWMVSPAYTCGSNDALKFWYYQFYALDFYDYSGVWISTASGDPIANPGDFTEIQELNASAPGGFSEEAWTEFTYNLAAYSGQTIYVAFKYRGDWSHELYIDDFSLDSIDSCPPPTMLSISNLLIDGVDLSWMENGLATQWEVEWDTTGFTVGTGNMVITSSNPHTLAGLNSNTTYDFYVRPACDSGDSSAWVGPYSFTTLCGPYSVPFAEGFNSSSTTESCWRVFSANGDGVFWGLNDSTNVQEGDEAASFFSLFLSGHDDYLVSPQITLTGNERLRFFYRAHAASDPDDFEVLLSTTGVNPSDFTNVLIVDTADNETYMERIIDLSAFSGNVFIAFRVPPTDGDGWRLYIDNVRVENIPTCEEPANIMASAINPSDATIGWTENASATQWVLQWDTTGFALGTGNTMVTSSNPQNITGLNPLTTYDFYVRSFCTAGDSSVWVGPYTFTTPCQPTVISTFPWTENFDADTVPVMPCGWVVNDLNGDNYEWGTSTLSAASAPNAMAIYHDSIPMDDWAFTPEFSFTAGQTYRLKFSHNVYAYGVNQKLEVMLGTGQSAAAMTTTLFRDTTLNNQYYNTESIPFTAPTTGTYAIGFHAYSTDKYRINIDDVMVSEDNITCFEPMSLDILTVSDTNASFTWQEIGSATQWVIQWDSTGFALGTGNTSTVSATNATISSLQAGTTYDFYVRSLCGAGDSSIWVGPYTFNTPCQAPAINTFPWLENFDGVTFPAIPCGWLVNDLAADNRKWETDTLFSGSAPNAIAIKGSSNPKNDWLFTPEFNFVAGQAYHVIFSYKAGYGVGLLNVMAGNNQTPAAMNTMIHHYSYLYAANFVQDTLVFIAPTTGSYYIGLHAYSGINSYYGIFIDDFRVEETCLQPVDLAVSNITATGADLAWTEEGTTTQWEVQVDTSGFTPGTGTSALTSGNPYSLSSLNPETTYDVYVRSVCGAGDSSAWSGPYTFTTICLPPVISTFPWTEDFDGETVPEMPCGWLVNDANGDGITWETSSYSPLSASNAMRIKWNDSIPMNDWAFTPEFNFTGGQAYKLTFSYRASVFDEKLEVVLNSNSTPGSTVTMLLNEPDLLDTGYVTVTIPFMPASTGSYYIGFHAYSNAGSFHINIDDISVIEYSATCVEPSSVSVSLMNFTEAEVNWNETAQATEWEVQWGTSGFVLGSGTTALTSTKPYTITSLAAGTSYDVYVRSVCGAGDSSIWVGPYNVTVPCQVAPINTFPWVENFDGETIPMMPCGWWVNDGNGDGITWETIDDVSASLPNSMAIEWNITEDMDDWAFTPEFNFTAANDYELVFSYRVANSNYSEKLEVMIGTDQLSGSMTASLFNDTSITDTIYVTDTIPFNVAADGSYFIGFHGYSNADQFAMSIDDVIIIENITTAVEDQVVTDKLSIYPNPSKGIFTIEGRRKNAEVKVTNVQGKIVYQNKLLGNKHVIDISRQAKGLYCISISSEDGIEVHKVIVH